MKKLSSIAATIFTVASLAGTSGTTLAASCSINNTGPNSFNSCEENEDHSVTITCTNGVRVTNDNTQTANSGLVVVSGNTSGGNGTSGDATNASQTALQLATNCGAAAVTTTTPTPPTTPAATPAVAGASTTVKSLPKTGNDNAPAQLALAALSMGTLAAAAQIAVKVYRRRILS
jgi:hypothetical protein